MSRGERGTSWSTALLERAANVRLVSFDVDGVLTDGLLYYCDDGREFKAFNVQDGSAIKLMLEVGLDVAIITGRDSAMVSRRAAELGIRFCYQGADDKPATMERLRSELGLQPNEVAHVGDDLPDLELFQEVGLAISVANGHPVVQAAAHHVTALSGGSGVAREVAELLLTARLQWPYG